MKINITRLQDLINSNFEGNYKKFAAEVNVNSSTVYRIITGRANAGEKFLQNFIIYCKNHGDSFEKYIFLN